MPTLAVILAYILEVLGLLQSVKGLIESLKGASADVAVEASPFSIDLRTQSTDNILHDATVGLANLKLQIGLVREDYGVGHAACILDVLTAIAALPAYVLPDNPPIGWTTDITAGVWAQPLMVAYMCAED